MAAYIVGLIDVTDPEQYQAYAQRAGPAGAKFGITYLARGGRTVGLEGPPPPARVVIGRFESVEAAEAFYNSPDYQEAKSFREGAADARIFIVEGAD